MLDQALVRSSRFIPAGAGNTPSGKSSSVIIPVYPRWRGEHSPTAPTSLKAIGLSPLARGTRHCRQPHRRRRRFIPAGAGNTTAETRSNPRFAVYPRWRGEHDTVTVSTFAFNGLSPLARGTLINGTYKVLSYRFIPAGAGNTFDSFLPTPHISVYPRWRGEHFAIRG